jgi:hypothetical protein
VSIQKKGNGYALLESLVLNMKLIKSGTPPGDYPTANLEELEWGTEASCT